MKNNMKDYREMFLYSNINKKDFITLITLSLLMAFSNIFIALNNNYLIDNIVNIDIKFIIIYIACILINALSLRQYIFLTRVYKNKVKFNLQKDILLVTPKNKDDWLMNLDIDSEILSDYVFRTIIPLFLGFSEFILALVFGFLVSWRLTIVILFLSSLTILFPKFLLNFLKKDMEEKFQTETNFKNFIISFLENFIVIQSFNAFDFFKKEFNKIYQKQEKDIMKVKKKQYFFMSFSMGIGFLMNTLWMVVAIILINNNQLTLGALVGFMAINSNFNWVFFEMPDLLVSLKDQKVSYNRLKDYLHKKKHIADDKVQGDIRTIMFQNVSFKYDNKKVIEDFSAIINENVVVYGESGSGKTTFIKLILGILTPDSGTIFADDEKITNHNSYKFFSYVPQQEAIFNDSIKSNILLGNPDSTFEQIQEAARKAKIETFIESLPNKYDTIIGETSEISLSYGQSKRISLARALIKDANVILLDEPTADIDDKTKKDIFESLKKYTGIVIIVSHEKDAIELFSNKIKLGK